MSFRSSSADKSSGTIFRTTSVIRVALLLAITSFSNLSLHTTQYMGNVEAKVKAVASHVAPSVDDDGMVEVIEKFVL